MYIFVCVGGGDAYLWNVVSSAKNVTRMQCECENIVKKIFRKKKMFGSEQFKCQERFSETYTLT